MKKNIIISFLICMTAFCFAKAPKIQAGSDADPFKNTKWENSKTKIEFFDNGEMETSVIGIAKYSVKQKDDAYIISWTTIQFKGTFEISSADATSGMYKVAPVAALPQKERLTKVQAE